MREIIKKTAKSIFRSIDPWATKILKIKTPTYTQDPNLLEGNGVYKAEEWTLTRKKGAKLYGTNGSQYDSENNYIQYLFKTFR